LGDDEDGRDDEGRCDVFGRESGARIGSGGITPPDCARRFSRPRCQSAANTALA
jgi:hypothetical protein